MDSMSQFVYNSVDGQWLDGNTLVSCCACIMHGSQLVDSAEPPSQRLAATSSYLDK